jgi:glutamine amidotransferase
MATIALLDYGMGNLRSAEKAFERVGADVERSPDPALIDAADGIVLPGVGAFAEAMRRIGELGLAEPIRRAVGAGKPLLGICLGMQLLFERSSELGESEGLGLLRGDVGPMDAPGLKVPHIGWTPTTRAADSPLLDGIADGEPFYFVHSYRARPADVDDVAATAEYGERFAAIVARPPVFGAQFHPEKSSRAGLRLLANFTAICAAVPAP